MDIIQYKDIELDEKDLNKSQGTKSKVYIKQLKCYKIFTDIFDDERKIIFKKFKEMEGMELKDVILPNELIMKDDLLVGYTMDYFSNSENLYDYFTKERFQDINEILNVTKRVSQMFRNIHSLGIKLQDISFDNILIDNNGNLKICDIDSCSYKNYQGSYISMASHLFYSTCKYKEPVIDESFDNVSLLLSALLTIYHKMIFELRNKDYEKIAKHVQTLQNFKILIKKMYLQLKPQIPYLDDFICDDEHYIIDRNKQVSLTKRICKNYTLE